MSPELVKSLAAAAAATAAAISLTAWVRTNVKLHRLRAESTTDALTGLLNRRGWEQAAAEWTCVSGGAADFVILADCNGLKAINDRFGHEAGDAIIAEAATVLRSVLPGAICARLGGDEFAALVTWDEFGPLRTRKRPLIATAAFAAGTVRSRLAVGAAKFNGDLADAMRRADAAMYRNKATGESPMSVFERDCDDHAVEDRPQIRTRDFDTTGPAPLAADLHLVGGMR